MRRSLARPRGNFPQLYEGGTEWCETRRRLVAAGFRCTRSDGAEDRTCRPRTLFQLPGRPLGTIAALHASFFVLRETSLASSPRRFFCLAPPPPAAQAPQEAKVEASAEWTLPFGRFAHPQADMRPSASLLACHGLWALTGRPPKVSAAACHDTGQCACRVTSKQTTARCASVQPSALPSALPSAAQALPPSCQCRALLRTPERFTGSSRRRVTGHSSLRG